MIKGQIMTNAMSNSWQVDIPRYDKFLCQFMTNYAQKRGAKLVEKLEEKIRREKVGENNNFSFINFSQKRIIFQLNK